MINLTPVVVRTDSPIARAATIASDAARETARACDAPRGRVLTNRSRRRLRKLSRGTSIVRNEGQHPWVAKFVAAGVKAYGEIWERKLEPPSPGVEKMLNRVAARFDRSGRIDLRQIDRRFWEMLFVCGWWPFAADQNYWPEQWQGCRRRLQWQHERDAHNLRERHGEAAPDVASAYRESPVRGNLYDWWCSLTPGLRDKLKEESRAIYEGKDAFSDRKRKNAKKRSR